MNGVRRAVVVAAISAVCLGACGDDSPSPVDAGNSGTTEVMTDETDVMTDGTEVMTDETDVMTDGTEVMTDKTDVMTDGTEVMTDKSTSTTGG